MVICQGIVREMSGNFEPTQMWQPCCFVKKKRWSTCISWFVRLFECKTDLIPHFSITDLRRHPRGTFLQFHRVFRNLKNYIGLAPKLTPGCSLPLLRISRYRYRGGGAQGTRPPPVEFLLFSCSFLGKNWPNSMLVSSLRGWRSPPPPQSGKFLIRHCSTKSPGSIRVKFTGYPMSISSTFIEFSFSCF